MNEGKPTRSTRPNWWSRSRSGAERAESPSPAQEAGETIQHETAEATPAPTVLPGPRTPDSPAGTGGGGGDPMGAAAPERHGPAPAGPAVGSLPSSSGPWRGYDAAGAAAPEPHAPASAVPAAGTRDGDGGSMGAAGAERHGSPSSGGPWSRYDPWAAAPFRAPLQEHGTSLLTPRRRRRRTLLGGALALALVSGGAGGLVGAYVERNGGVGTVRLPQAGKEPAGRAPDSVAGIAARALPGVVTLHVAGSDDQGTGTGFVLDRLGHVLTDNHVVEPAASGGGISVTFSGGQTVRARIVGRDPGYDLAVVQVRGVRGLTPVPLGNSDNVRVGDPVVAIGAPFGLANTVTSGIVSAKERPITAGGEKGDGTDVSYVDALQTDAPINPGNSGGPLLDARGRVVGVNSAIRSAGSGADVQGGQAGSIGLGFAIPVNQARRVAEELINTGRATHPVIGVTLDMGYAGDGARVAAASRGGGAPVTPHGPGDRAGIRAGDVVTAVDGRRVHTGEELIVRTRAHRPGDRLELTVERDGRQRTVSLVLGSSGGG
ncbi:S1C family serine protease [Streptomyces sp. NPDC003697]